MRRSCGSLIFRSKKCVVNPRCLGDYPASCGVCISTPADFIVAKLTTITRSINVAIALRIFENAMDYRRSFRLGPLTMADGWQAMPLVSPIFNGELFCIALGG